MKVESGKLKVESQFYKLRRKFRKFSILNSQFSTSHESGQTLVEAIVALSALMISLAGISIAVIYAVNNTTFVKNQNLANKYAQQGMEYLKNKAANGEKVSILNNPDDDFRNLNTTYCFNETYILSTPAGGCSTNLDCNGNSCFFKRSVAFKKSNCGDNAFSGTEVTVTVSWPSSKCTDSNTYCHKAQLNSCFAQGTNTSL